MTGAVLPGVNEQTIESLDFGLPCDCSQHERCGTGAATMALFMKPTKPCGHPIHRSVQFYCTGCWETRVRIGTQCVVCHSFFGCWDSLIKVEPL